MSIPDALPAAGQAPEEWRVDLDGFEGPIALLLSLAREQKVDLKQISILALAEAYLRYIAEARRLRIEIAADYLVMAAWLAFLKSRLLLPDPPEDEEAPSAEDMAAALALRLRRLAAMQQAGAALFQRPLLGRDTFLRGEQERAPSRIPPVFVAGLHDLLAAYAGLRRHAEASVLTIAAPAYVSVEEALRRLMVMLAPLPGRPPEWRRLEAFLAAELGVEPDLRRRSALAATFVASLELAKSGRIELRQDRPFGPILLRASRPPEMLP